MTMNVRKIISDSLLNDRVKFFCLKNIDILNAVVGRNDVELTQRVSNQLMRVKDTNQIYANGLMHIIKRCCAHQTSPNDSNSMIVTDHALVRFFERGGLIDIAKMRDVAEKKHKEFGLVPIKAGRKIVTFINDNQGAK